MSVSASENGEMSVNTETIKTSCSEANSHPNSLQQLSECTGNHNIIPTVTEVTMTISDGSDTAATGPEPAKINHAGSTDTRESAGQKGRGSENQAGRRRWLHHAKQQQQQRPPKRRNTVVSGFKHPAFGKRRRRANSESDSVLPTNFYLGGNIHDPLNLGSLQDEDINRALNAETPRSSPLPSRGRDPVEIIIPRDITDPLNLNSGLEMSPFKRKRHRNRHHGGGGGGGGGGSAAAAAAAGGGGVGGAAAGGVGGAAGGGGGGGVGGAAGGGGAAAAAAAAAGGGGGGHGISATLSESAKSEAKMNISTLPPVPEVPRGTRGSSLPGDSHEYKESNSSSCEERLATSAPAPQPAGDSASAGPSQHSNRRKRRRHAGKADHHRASSSPPRRKPRSEERHAHVETFQTPQSGPRHGGQQHQNHGHHRHQKQKFEFGNYSKYYGYRNPSTSEDPRVHLLRPEWFQGKKVLDLGCNSGHLTLYIAKTLRPAHILGLDIDSGLINVARKNIRHYLSEQQTQEARRATQGEGKSEPPRGAATQTLEQEQDRNSVGESGPAGATRGESGPAGATRGESGPAGATRGESGPAGATRGESGPAGATRGESGPDRAVRGESGPVGATRGESGPAGATRGESGPVGATRGESGPVGATRGESGPDRAVRGQSAPGQAGDVSSGHPEDVERCEKTVGLPFPVSLQITRGPIAAPLVTETPTAPPGRFPLNVSFIKANYVLENERLLLTQRPEYDVILCLSVTKWVHLNWGDSGLKRLFHRAYRHLNPGGLFILEPQPWDSYGKRKKLSDNTFRNYHSIRLKPDHFSTYLTNEVGFAGYELIGTPRCSAKGFQRPIYLFHK